ncbi:hypothetical protein ACFYUY_11295 [Kitasatospora sp. NPDC004745]|uniref:hypothetical protein n=1 Tax=Kitasatospora sp. NPDC004745 TaxID=3364019 RepID=UPI0036789FFF
MPGRLVARLHLRAALARLEVGDRLDRDGERAGGEDVLTGIHPQGTLGVVHLIVNDLADLYQQAGTGRFSVLLNVDYNPQDNEPVRVRLLSPFYRHEAD